MAQEITYTCDVCKKPITGPNGVMKVVIHGEDTLHDLELCSWKCLKKFVDDKNQPWEKY